MASPAIIDARKEEDEQKCEEKKSKRRKKKNTRVDRSRTKTRSRSRNKRQWARARDACSTCRKTSLLLADVGTGGRLGLVAQKEKDPVPRVRNEEGNARGHGNLTFGGSIPRK